MLGAVVLFVTTIQLIQALRKVREFLEHSVSHGLLTSNSDTFVVFFIFDIGLIKEHEEKMVPWMVCMLAFTVWRFFTFIFAAVVNDLIFSFNVIMCLIWIVLRVLTFVNLGASPLCILCFWSCRTHRDRDLLYPCGRTSQNWRIWHTFA
jgi:hypothetical protein